MKRANKARLLSRLLIFTKERSMFELLTALVLAVVLSSTTSTTTSTQEASNPDGTEIIIKGGVSPGDGTEIIIKGG